MNASIHSVDDGYASVANLRGTSNQLMPPLLKPAGRLPALTEKGK